MPTIALLLSLQLRFDEKMMSTGGEAEYSSNNAAAVADADLDALPEVPDDGVLIQALYVGVCHATHSLPLDTLDLTSYVGQ